MTTRIDGATGVDLIKDDTVTELDIKDGAVTNDKIAMGIDAAKLTGTLPSDVAPGGLPGVLSLDGDGKTTAQTGTFVPSGNTIIVTGCGGGATGSSNNTNSGSRSKGGGGGSGAGVMQAVMNVTAGAIYNVSCAINKTVSISDGGSGTDGNDTTITLNGGSTILTLGGGTSGTSANAGEGGMITVTTDTVGTAPTGTMVAGSITIPGSDGFAGNSAGDIYAAGRGGCGVFGSRDIYTSTSVQSTGAIYDGNQRGRGADGITGGASTTGSGGFITILY